MSKLYCGRRLANDAAHVSVDEGGVTRPLNPRFDLAKHSPDGFNWGYGGSGPAQLALAMLADALGDDARARRLYMRFKFRVIGRLPHESWRLTAASVRATAADIEREGASHAAG